MSGKDHKLTFYQTARFAARPLTAFWQDSSMFLNVLERAGRFDADRISVNLGSKHIILLKDAEDIKQILSAPADQVGHAAHQKKIVGVGEHQMITNSEGEEWKQKRKNVSKFMGVKGMKLGFQDEARAIVADHIATWKESPAIAVAQEASRLSLKYMFKGSFNHELSNEDCDVLHNIADDMHKYLYWSVIGRVVLPKSVVKKLTGVEKATQKYNDLADKLIEKYETMDDEAKQRHMFSALLSDQNTEDIDQELIRTNIREMMIAGHLSVRTSFYWALHNIARRPDIQEQIRHETPDNGFAPILKPGKDMTLSMSMKAALETVRLYPPFYVFPKETKCEFNGLDGHPLPKGSTIVIPPWLVHRNSDYYPNPNEFDPDTNFAPHEIGNRSRFAFLPFGHGPHNCPGSGLSLQQLSSTLTEICNNYTIKPVGDDDLPRVHADVFLKPENDSTLIIEPI